MPYGISSATRCLYARSNVAHERVLPREEIPQRRLFFHAKVDAMQLPAPKACQIQRRLAQRLERDAGVRHRAAQGRCSLTPRSMPLA
jgi:hypothetical protein